MLATGLDLHRVVILTAIPVEYQAVRAHLTNIREEHLPQGTIYERGTFSSNGHSWDVVVGEIGPGNPTAAVEAERAINYFRPNLILFVGIAGGRKDVKLGDVVAATKVYGYESGKAEEAFLPRPSIGISTYPMEQRARAEARKSDWLQRLKGPPLMQSPVVYVAPIAAGEKVIASTWSHIAQFLKTNYGDALAVEMEGYGFLQAVRANPHVEALVIRGISDLLDGKQEADAANFQGLAAKHASAFAFEILAKFDRPRYEARMLPIPPGSFLYGRKDKQHYLESYRIDECLVTVAQYTRFLHFIRETGNHSRCHPEEPEQKDHTPQDWQLQRAVKLQHPVVGIDWFDAYAFAAWCGKELPSEQQWEKAARGEHGQLYPWGNTFLEQHCNALESDIGDTSEVTMFPNGRSPYGCYDMLGNVWEWTSGYLNEDNPAQVLRGGAFNLTKKVLKVTLYTSALRIHRSKFFGFRCVCSES